MRIGRSIFLGAVFALLLLVGFACYSARSGVLTLPGGMVISVDVMWHALSGAQAAAPDAFVMCLAYGESWPGYIPTAAIFSENFQDSWLWVGPGSEKAIRRAIHEVLRK